MKVFPISAVAVLCLAGCGGSSTTTVITNDPVVPDVLPQAGPDRALRNAGAFQTDAVLLGLFQVDARQGTTNVFDTATSETGAFSGTYNYETQQFVVTSQGQTLVLGIDDQAFQGRDVTGYSNVGVVTPFLETPAGADGDSDFRITGSLIAGNPTRLDDMQISGDATMTGDGLIIIDEVTEAQGLRSDVLLEIDFGDGFLDLTLTPEGDPDPANLADQVEVRDMVIDGTGFSGGTLVVTKDGSEITPVGLNPTFDAQGQFFGRNGAGTGPDEAGGFFEAAGNGNSVSAEFLAD